MECTFWREAEELQLKVKQFVFEALGPEHPRAMAISQFLAATYLAQTRANEAAELHSQVLQVYMKSLGPRHPKTHKIMDTLGESRGFQGRYKESHALHKGAIREMERSFQGESKEVLEQLEEVAEGMERVSPKDFDTALEICGEAIKKMRGKSVTKPEDLFIAWNHMGQVEWRYFRYEEAKKYFKKSSLGLVALLGPADSRTEAAMLDMATCHMNIEGELSCGKEETLDDAHAILKNLYDQRRNTLGDESPLTLLAQGQLARIESARGNHTEAEQAFRKIIPIVERTLGPYHFGSLAARSHFAKILIRQNQFDEAERLLAKSIVKSKYKNAARNDGNHPDHIATLWYLVQYYELRGNVKDAIARVVELEDVLDSIGGEGLGKQHPFAKKVAAKREELEGRKREREEVLVELAVN
jgi:tetratricopeptide (TPR) repeat protein